MMDDEPHLRTTALWVGALYVAVGALGFLGNVATALVICTQRVYRLSAYTLMANIALADALVLLVSGGACGAALLAPSIADRLATTAASEAIDRNGTGIRPVFEREDEDVYQRQDAMLVLRSMLSLVELSAWTAGVMSYALLGANRCIAICFYGTPARSLNRVGVALAGVALTWLVGMSCAVVGTHPRPLMAIRLDLWSVSFVIRKVVDTQSKVFVLVAASLNALSVAAQWSCSTLVLLKIGQVRQKISRRKLNQNSANRFRKQARLTFQFFYPSLLCTISSILYFTKPFIAPRLSDWHLIALHLLWLLNHSSNPFIYAYFNDRMRLSYRELLTCSRLRYLFRKHRFWWVPSWLSLGSGTQHERTHNVSRRSNAPTGARTKQSMRSLRGGSERGAGNFVRSSLQMQSRDFEQLCEFIMRVNPMYDSSEGWRESSEDEAGSPADEDSGNEKNKKKKKKKRRRKMKEETPIQYLAVPEAVSSRYPHLSVTEYRTRRKSVSFSTDRPMCLELLARRRADEAGAANSASRLSPSAALRATASVTAGTGSDHENDDRLQVLHLGRDAVEQWVRFAKKASI